MRRSHLDRWALGAMQNDAKFKAHRRLFEQNFRASIAGKYHKSQFRTTVIMLQNLLSNPAEFTNIIHQCAHTVSEAASLCPFEQRRRIYYLGRCLWLSD